MKKRADSKPTPVKPRNQGEAAQLALAKALRAKKAAPKVAIEIEVEKPESDDSED